jgi:predicted Zn-dependent protease
MAAMRPLTPLVVLAFACTGCGFLPPSLPSGAYYPDPRGQHTTALAQTLYRAARASGDDPTRYSFTLVQTDKVAALSAPDTVFYFSEGLAAQPPAHQEALVAQAVAHEVLAHQSRRRAISLGISVGFTAVGLMVPGLGLADLVVNPLIVRAFSRDQELAADRKALEILAAMGHPTPRRALAAALAAAAGVNGPSQVWAPLAEQPDLGARLVALEPLEPPTEVARAASQGPGKP